MLNSEIKASSCLNNSRNTSRLPQNNCKRITHVACLFKVCHVSLVLSGESAPRVASYLKFHEKNDSEEA